jgi:hypothetical protein
MIRGAMLTPWAVVSLGIVLAASLTLATPRAVLTFPPSSPDRCQAANCGPNGNGLNGGPLPTAKLGVKFPAIRTGPAGGVSAGHSSRRVFSASHGPVRVQYALLPRYSDHFVAVIVITSQRALGDWTLRFAIPGSQIKLVMLARWQPLGHDGGIASDAPWSSAPSGEYRARIVIMGTGAPGRPRGCVFDGVRCSFRDFSGGVTKFDWRPGTEKAAEHSAGAGSQGPGSHGAGSRGAN